MDICYSLIKQFLYANNFKTTFKAFSEEILTHNNNSSGNTNSKTNCHKSIVEIINQLGVASFLKHQFSKCNQTEGTSKGNFNHTEGTSKRNKSNQHSQLSKGLLYLIIQEIISLSQIRMGQTQGKVENDLIHNGQQIKNQINSQPVNKKTQLMHQNNQKIQVKEQIQENSNQQQKSGEGNNVIVAINSNNNNNITDINNTNISNNTNNINNTNNTDSKIESNPANNNMVKIGLKRKNKGQNIDPIPNGTQTNAPKFVFDDNFKDQPLTKPIIKYSYQPLNLLSVKPNQQAMKANPKIIVTLDEGFTYKVRPNINMTKLTQKKYTPKPLTNDQINLLRDVLFKKTSPVLPKSWSQGLIMSPHEKTPFGIQQLDGGPCGIIASIQCYFLKHLLWVARPSTPEDLTNETIRQICLTAAIADMLMKVRSASTLSIVGPPRNFAGIKLEPSMTQVIQVTVDSFKSAFDAIWINREIYIGKTNHGVTALLYSVIMTKGPTNISAEIDNAQTPLIGQYGHCTQELVNLFLTGTAASNLFNGVKDLDGSYKLRGIESRSQFGFLTVYETLKLMQVGTNLKTPCFPCWVISKQYHYHVVFVDSTLIAEADQCDCFDVVYFDGLYNCSDFIRITLSKPTDDAKPKAQKDYPLIQQVLATKWGLRVSNWNGSVVIL